MTSTCTFSQESLDKDIKAAAKLVGKSLKTHGHAVPHSVLLHALSSAMGENSWHTLKTKLAAHTKAQPAASATASVPVARQYPTDASTLRWVRLALFMGARIWQEAAPLSRWTFTVEENDGPAFGSFFDSAKSAAQAAMHHIARQPNDAGHLLVDGVFTVNGGTKFTCPATMNLSLSHVDAPCFDAAVRYGDFFLRNKKGETLKFWCVNAGTHWALTEVGLHSLEADLYALFKHPFADAGDPAEAAAVAPRTVVQATPAAPAAPMGPSVTARFFSDDHVFDFEFDASEWMAQASDKELTAVFNCGFGGDYPTDDIGTWMTDQGRDTEFKDAFVYIDAIQKRQSLGFEVKVDGEEFCFWLKLNRPAVLAKCLCERYSVSITPSKEAELRGMFDWVSTETDSSGNKVDCARSFATEEDAAIDASETLDLLDQFGEDGCFASV